MIIGHFIHVIFLSYTILLFLRILSSWLPFQWQANKLVQFLAYYTDPFLGVFRRIVPPIGGVLDLSPVLAFFALKIMEIFLLGLFR